MAMPAGVEPASTDRQSAIISDIPRHHLYKGRANIFVSQPLCIYYIRNLNKNQIIFIEIFF